MSLEKWVLTEPVQVVAILYKIAGNLVRSDIESLLTPSHFSLFLMALSVPHHHAIYTTFRVRRQ
jgi:hypothetical protein